jgi:transcriptional regulator of acetoin/glycerol metabolism
MDDGISLVAKGLEVDVIRRADQVADVPALGGHVAEVGPFLGDFFEVHVLVVLVAPGSPTAVEDSPEKSALIKALRRTNGNQTQAALLLGINRVTVWNRMRKYGLDVRILLNV